MFRRKATPAPAPDPVSVLRRALHGGYVSLLEGIVSAGRDVIDGALWNPQGTFETFGHFAIAAEQEGGLAVRDNVSAALVRKVLLELHCFGEWLFVLRLIARKPGRPRSSALGGEFQPFYRVPTAKTSIDRMLLVLDRDHPDVVQQVIQGELSPTEAARRVGIIEHQAFRYGGVCDLSRAANLSDTAQGKLLCKLFGALGLNAQCALLHLLEDVMGPGLAKKWRDHHNKKSG